MNAAVNGGTYKQQYPIDSDSPVYVKDIDASGLWKKIIHNAWKSAEPGVLFWTRSYVSLYQTAMRIWGSVRFPRILVARYLFVRMIVAVC